VPSIAVVVVAGQLALSGGAVGLVVPDAGPRTSEDRARASLVCGEVVNSLRGERPACERPLVRIVDAAPLRLQLPQGGEQPNDRRYPIQLVGARGLLTSDSTRIPGLVSIADIGRQRLEVVPHEDPVGYLEALDERIRENGEARVPAFLLAVALLAGLALLSGRAAVAGLAAALAANLALGAAGISDLWAVLTVVGLAIAAGGPLLARLPLVPLCAAVLAAYLGALAAEGTWVALSPLGPSQNSRFFGLSNLLETLLLVPAFVGASRRLTFVPVAVLAVVMVAGSSFGADGGGAVVLAAGFAMLAYALFHRWAALPLAAVAAAAALAILLGPETHVTRSAGGGALVDRVVLSWERVTDNWGVGLAVAGALVLLAALVVRGPLRPLPLALAAAVAVSMIVNDSPFEVALGGLIGYLTLDRYDSPR
jgi:hypothetical protein